MIARSVGLAIVFGTLHLALGPVAASSGEAGWLGVTFSRGDRELRTEVAASVESVHAGVGDRVATGDLLLRLIAPDLDVRVEQARAVHAAAEARAVHVEVELAEAAGTVARRLAAPDIFSVVQVEAAEFARTRAAADLAAARAGIAEHRAVLADLLRTRETLEVRAPAEGVVASSWWDPREHVPAGSVVVRLTGCGEIFVRFAAPGVAALSPGVPVTVSQTGATWAATVRMVAPEVDPRIGLLLAEAVVVPGEASLRPGETVRVHRATSDLSADGSSAPDWRGDHSSPGGL